MADDIDIEEHDVLDHPRIKHILPDLDLDLLEIKTEAHISDNEDCMVYEEDYNPNDHVRDSFRNSIVYEDPEVQYKRISNKIILGSKPCSSTSSPIPHANKEYPLLTSLLEADSELTNGTTDVEVKTEPPDDYNDFYIQQRPSVFILGSKPSTEQNVNLEERNVEDAIVFLEDWGPRLERSSCYCKECEILFPTRNAIDSHKMSVHSFLVALDTNKAVKSTAKSFDYKNTARKSTCLPNQPSTSNANCHHCSKTFSDYTALIKHLYDIIPSDKFKCDKCEAVFDQEAELKTHIEEHDNETSYLGIQDRNSQFFKCTICSYLFISLHRYKNHMQVNHLETQINYTTFPSIFRCENCSSQMTGLNSLNNHIRKIHPKLYLMKAPVAKAIQKDKNLRRTTALLDSPHKSPFHNKLPEKLIPEPKLMNKLPHVKPETNQMNSNAETKFQCLVCHEEFSSYYSASAHKVKKHPNFKNRHLFSKIAVRKRKPPSQFQKAAKAPLKKDPEECVYKDVSNSPVPKDTLFKCNQCLIHFTSCYAAGIHSRNCLQYKGDWKCQICRRMFKINDRLAHQQQHDVEGRFNVYIINDHLYGRVLCQCPDCNLYFHEQDFWKHRKFGCRLSKPCKCRECDLPIHASSIDVHNRWHQDLEIERDEFILINYVNVDTDIGSETQGKRKLAENSESTPAKKAKFNQEDKEYAVRMFYCMFCKCNISGLKHREHKEGKCLKFKLQTKICKCCGLLVSSKSLHSKIHEQQRGLKLKDFKIIRIQDQKRISPPIPEYPKCSKCDVLFVSKTALIRHECHSGHKTCRYCKKKFSDLAYKLHLQFHEYNAKIRNPQLLEKSDSNPDYEIPQKKEDMPGLLEKYEQLTKTWNILYLCQICEIVCDSYDKMVEHCQNHFSNLESYDMIVKECRVCGLKFDATCFDKHRALHSTNKSVNRTSFDILSYNYTDLFSNEWFNLFGDLPQSQIQQIVSQSIYNYTRKIKMRIVVDGPPEFTLYKCAKCENYVNPLTLVKHRKYASCSKTTTKHHCQICRIPFSSETGKKNHTLIHKNNKIKTFRSVLINEDDDEEFNRTLERQEGETQAINKDKGKVLNKIMRLYKCTACQCCLKDEWKHEQCGSAKFRKCCPKCNLYFSSKSMFSHKRDHEKMPALSRKNIKVTLFTPKGKQIHETKKIANIYKCGCGLHFTSQKTVDKHLEDCGPDQEISSENCSKCGLLFPTDVLVNHLLSHHSNDKYTKFEVKDVRPNEMPEDERQGKRFKVFKCTKCDLCYMSSSSLQSHISLNHTYSMKLKCNTCGLKFTKSSLMKHISYHHLKHKCQLKDIKIEEHAGQTRKEIPAYNVSKSFLSKLNLKNYSRKLYKCPECPLHFLVKVSLSNHKASGTHATKENKIGNKCTKCGITFGYQTLPRHKFIHHEKLKLSLKDFIIIQDKGVATNPQNFKTNGTQAIKPKTEVKTLMGRLKNLKWLESSIKNKYSRNLYKCTKCDLHFITLKTLEWHSSTNEHRTKSKTKCNICGLTFTQHSLPRHLYKHHHNMKLKLEDFNIVTEDSKGYQGKTNDLHLDQDTTEISEYKETHLNKEPNTDDSPDKYSVDEQNSSNTTELYNYLYKCDDCDLHFLNKVTLRRHIAAKQHDDPGTKCTICDLKFQSANSLRKHKKIQHNELDLSRDDFCILYSKDIFTDENDTATINSTKANSASQHLVYKCNICSVHFLKEHTLQYHLITPGRNHKVVKTSPCTDCGLDFGTINLKKHIKIHHDQMKLRLKDLTIITGSVVDNNFVIDCVYKCSECRLYFMRHKAFELHRCRIDPSLNVKCKVCYYSFSVNSIAHHKKTHHDLSRLKRDDIQVILLNSDERKTVNADDSSIEFETEKTMAKEDKQFNKSKESICSLDMSSYKNYLFKCSNCNLHYISKNGLKNHIRSFKNNCKSRITEIECDLCGLNFGSQMIQQHKEAHHERLNLQLEDFTIVTESQIDSKLDNLDIDSMNSDSDFDSTFIDSKSRKNIVEEARVSQTVKTRKLCQEVLLNKITLSQLNSKTFDNRLYKCNVCTLHFISSTAFRKHNHYSTKVICTACGLKFTAYTLARHEYVHHKKLKCKKFKITVYGDGDETYDIEYMPKTLILNSDIDLTQSSTSTADVTDIESSKSINMHSTSDIDIGKVAPSAVDEKDLSVDCEDNAEVTTTTRAYKMTKAFKMKLKKNLKKYSKCIYRCSICYSHYLTLGNLQRHESKCTNDLSNNTVCPHCNFSFSLFILARHQYIHHEVMKLKREDFTVTDLMLSAPKIDNVSPTPKVIKTLQDNCNSLDTPVSIDGSVILQRDDEVDEIRTYTSTPLLTNDKDYNNKLYRCNECDVHFITEKSFDGHISKNLHDVLRKACVMCGLSFSLRTMNTHIKFHHGESNFKREDFKIIDKYLPIEATKDRDVDVSQSNDPESSIDEGNSPRIEKDSSVAQKNPIKLYKCGECNVYFITQATCYKHTTKHTMLESKDYIECKICGFQFRIISLHKHITMHHSTDFKLEDVLIEEYQPNTISNGTPKIDIYAAVNKVQSKLVSTTTEGRELDTTETEQYLNEQIEDSIITDVVNTSLITNFDNNYDFKIITKNYQENTTEDVSTNLQKISTDMEKVETVTENVDTVTENVDTVTENVDTVTENVDTVSENVDTVTENVDTVTETVDTVTENVDTVKEYVDTVTENVDTVTENVDTVTENVDTVTENVDTVTENVDTVTENVDTITENVDTIKEIVDTVTESVGTVETKFDEVIGVVENVTEDHIIILD